MALIVQKFGGTSVGTVERIRAVAERVAQVQKEGHRLVIVVSAMSGETDRLVGLVKAVDPDYRGREHDVVVSTGEQVTTALLAIALEKLAVKAASFQGHQVRILTDSSFSKARIQDIDTTVLQKALDDGRVAIVAGFQGIDSDGNITTLGRGGSDTTGVALAAALKADLCEIYTDVDGVYTTDPRVCKDAKKIQKLSYEEMLEMASTGAKVLQIRSVEFAAKWKVPLVVRSSFSLAEGTVICEEDQSMEKVLVSGVSFNRDEAKISIRKLPDTPGIASQVFVKVAEANINVDMIVQNVSQDGTTDLTFTVPKSDLDFALKIVQPVAKEIGAQSIDTNPNIAKVSVIGIGMRSHSGVAAQMFATLAHEKINIHMISTSEIKVSVVVDENRMEDAVRALHKVFGLGAQAA